MRLICGNRHCPNCQHEKTQAWLQKQSDRLLPVHHFLVTFIVPEELRGLLRACPDEGYDALFDAGAATIQDLLANPKWLGSSSVGFFGILQTWGRDPMVYHPHVHFVVPGGGVSNDGTKWLDGLQFPDDTRSREMAGVAVSWLDVLARQRCGSSTRSTSESHTLHRLRWCTARDRDDRRRRPHHLPRAARSRDSISGQWMTMMITRQKLRMNVLFKTRSAPCRIVVRADIKNLRRSKENRPRLAAIRASLSADLSQILTLDAVRMRFTANWPLKTDDSRRSCELLFPYATRRRSTTGLLEQLP